MDYKYIEQLLQRYWLCETTAEEETILRTFFSQSHIPTELAGYRDLFVYEQAEAKTQTLGADFDERLCRAAQAAGRMHANADEGLGAFLEKRKPSFV